MPNFRCAVIGAGPGGLAAVGAALDSKLTPLAWIDTDFSSAGRLSQYVAVPSNTKVSLFRRFGETPASFAPISSDSLQMFQGWHDDAGCPLTLARDMVKSLTSGVLDSYSNGDQVSRFDGRVQSISQAEDTNWLINGTDGKFQFQTSMVILATGSVPIDRISAIDKEIAAVNKNSNNILLSLEEVLNPVTLKHCLEQRILNDRHASVAVVGSSHSAILALKNLTEVLSTSPSFAHMERPVTILNFYRDDLKYAEYKKADKSAGQAEDWILYDNTGLKGQAAEWVKAKLKDNEPGQLEQDLAIEPGRVVIKRINNTDQVGAKKLYQKYGASIRAIVYAVGFKRNSLPQIITRSHGALPESSISHNGSTGQLQAEGVGPLGGLYGLGIAFPEKTTDPLGNVEDAVGLWKFMRYAMRLVPEAGKATDQKSKL